MDAGGKDARSIDLETAAPEPSGPAGGGRQTKLGGTRPEWGGVPSALRKGVPGRLARDAAAWFGRLSVLSKAVLIGIAVLVLVPWRPLAIVVLVLLVGLIGRALISRIAPPAGRGAVPEANTQPVDRKASLAVAAAAILLVLIVALALLKPDVIWGPDYEVVYEKEMSWMMGTMSGYDYTDNDGMIYIKVEVESPEDIDTVYEDLTSHSKVHERDCVAVDFLVGGDRSGGITDERVIENNPSCASDVEFFESRMGSLSEASRVNDVYGYESLKGEKNPEGW